MKKLVLVSAVVLLVLGSGRAASAQIAVDTFTAGWATFGQAVPRGVAPSGLQVGSLLTQTDVKTRWPDGSIRFAVVTVNVPTSGTYPITAAPIASGAFTPAQPSASVALAIGGVTYTAALPAIASTDQWLSGALVYEGRAVVAPVSSGAAHPFLRVIFDTRIYNDGTGRVDVAVENVLDQTGATTVTYNAAIAINNQTVFTKSSVQHYYLTRWRKTFTVGSAPIASVTPDVTPFYASAALPPYLSLVADLVSAPTGTNFDILQAGALDTNMPDHGGRQELAPYPDWTARYLVYRNPTQKAFVLAHGDLSGSWPVHVREAENGANPGVGPERLVSLDQRPTIWYDSRAKGDGLDFVHGSPMPIIEYGSTTPGPGQSPLIPDNAHQPSIAYVPYLLTGDRYYAEEMAFWANYGMLRTYPADGVRGSQGILAYNETRGYGWSLRNIVDAAAYYPGAEVRNYLAQKVTSNLAWLDNYANAQSPTANPFRILWIGKRPDGNQYIAMWEQNYLAYAIDRAFKQGFSGGLAHRDAIARFQLTLFNSDPAYPRAQAAPYIVGVGVPPAGTVRYTDYNSFTFYKTIDQIWTATKGNERPFAGYYGPEARLNLMIGVEAGWSGAQAAYDYLFPFIGSTNTFCATFGPDKPDLACRAGWAIGFSSAAPPPPPPPPPPPTVTSFAASPASIAQGQSSTLSWAVSNSTSVTIDQGIGAVGASGSAVVSPATTTTYTLTATNGSGSSIAKTTVTVGTTPPPTPPTVTSFSASPASITQGQSSTLSWAVSNATSVTIDQGIGTVTASGSRIVSPAATTTYTLTATNASGSSTARTTLTVGTTPPGTTGPAMDAVVSVDRGSASPTVTTSQFSTHAANELLLAFVSADYLGGTNTAVQSISGAGLTWTRVIRSNVQAGTSEIWRAFSAAALSSVTVSAQLSQSVVSSMTVVSFSNVDGTGINGSGAIGATAATSSGSGAPRATVVTTRANSWVFGVGNDYDNAIARTLGANQTMVHQDLAPVGDTYWVQRTTSTVPTAGTSVRINDTAPTSDRFNLAVCEVRGPQ